MSNIINFPTPKGQHEIPDKWIYDYNLETGETEHLTYTQFVEKQAFRMAYECQEFRKEIRKMYTMNVWQRIRFVIFGY